MYSLHLLLASLFAMCIQSAPTDFELHSALAVPIPNTETYDANLAVAVAHTRTHPAPSSGYMAATAAADRKHCGYYLTAPRTYPKRAYASEQYLCSDLGADEEMAFFLNAFCGLCMVFAEHQCQGDMLWSGGPASDKAKYVTVPHAKSYFCF